MGEDGERRAGGSGRSGKRRTDLAAPEDEDHEAIPSLSPR
jgi:hypothetical protein